MWKFVQSTEYSVLSTQYLVHGAVCSFLGLVLVCAAAAAPPKMNSLFPAGVQQGQAVVVTAAGDFSAWPVEVWADRGGLKISAEKDKGKFKIEAAADAVPGTYWLRAFNADGASSLRPFIVGTVAESVEVEANDTPDKPQATSGPVVINGKLNKSGDVDGYRVELKRGQTLVASLAANSVLGSPMDAVLQVCELVEKRYSSPVSSQGSGTPAPRGVEAYLLAQNHDACGLDPQIACTAPRDGTYLVRLFAFPATPDSSVRFAGGDDYIYRLTLTSGPYLDHVLPLAVPFAESQVELGGWNLASLARVGVPPFSATTDRIAPPDEPLAWVWQPGVAGAFAAVRCEAPTATSATKELPIPGVVSGRLAEAGQSDAFRLAAKKGQKLHFRVAAKSLGFPTDAVLTIHDAAGSVLAEADDAGRDDRDPQLEFTPPADGQYTIRVKELAGRGGERMVYRLNAEPARPDFSLSLAADAFVLEKGKRLEIPVNITVRDGLREAIEIHAVGLPQGLSAAPVKFVPSGDSPARDTGGGRRGRRSGSTSAPAGPSVKLVVQRDANVSLPAGVPIRIEGRTSGAEGLVRTARFSLNLPLAGQHHAVWVTLKE